MNCWSSICYRVGSGLEEDRERNVAARRKDFQKRGGVKPLNPVEPDGEPDTILDGESRNNINRG